DRRKTAPATGNDPVRAGSVRSGARNVAPDYPLPRDARESLDRRRGGKSVEQRRALAVRERRGAVRAAPGARLSRQGGRAGPRGRRCEPRQKAWSGSPQDHLAGYDEPGGIFLLVGL